MSLVGWILLLLVVAAAGFFLFRRRSPARLPRDQASLPPPSPTDDLDSLGLSEVRVAAKREASVLETAPAPPRPPEPRAQPAASPVRPLDHRQPESDRLSSVSAPRPVATSSASPRPAPAVLRPGTTLWPEGDRAVQHLLASLAAHVDGRAAVLRFDETAYVVEALAGGPSVLPDPIKADTCPLHRAHQDRVLTVLPSDLKGLAAVVDQPRAYARALAEPPATRAFLVVGTPETDDDPEVVAQVERYADLLAAMTELAAEPASEPADAEQTDAEQTGEEGAPVPRAALIEEEQEAARVAARPLAFALVTLADAEDRLTDDSPEDVARADADLHARLAEAEGVRRVEPFGDLLVGVFLGLTPEEMAAWCTDLAASEPPLFIGAVAPAEGAPEAIRDAAAEALRDAYDQRRAQIVAA